MSSDIDQVRDDVVRRTADELEIRNAVAKLAHFADTASADDLEGYLEMFTEDVTWAAMGAGRLGVQERQGRAAMEAGARERRAAGTQGPGSGVRHVITTQVVEFLTPDKALSRSYWQTFADCSTTPTPQAMGEYHDTFVRTSSGWKVQRREIRS